MKQIVPSYYHKFQCIASECQHNCCIGWEIDIDLQTLDAYRGVKGNLGAQLHNCIDKLPQPHFRLDDRARCPFLNNDNLCLIYQELGPAYLCQICRDHPRFCTCLPDRTETGIGLCCEAAAAIVLSEKAPATLWETTDSTLCDCCDAREHALLQLRDTVFSILQDRSCPISERVSRLNGVCYAQCAEHPLPYWVEFFLSLERLEDSWGKLLENLRTHINCLDFHAFDSYMSQREIEYEQFLVYIIYRHLLAAYDDDFVLPRLRFASLGYQLIHAAGALLLSQNGQFTFSDHVELVRMFSSEIEYSQQNLDAILGALQ